jgi:hypothetical protein
MSTTPAGNSVQDLNGNHVAAATYGGRRGGLKTKTLRRMLKKAGLKTSGKKATLRARCKKAKLMSGGYLAGMGHIGNSETAATMSGGRSRRRRSLFRKFF